ncbi:MAG: ATP-binding cassette domain-containing protein, partial [Alphaproteobacteria bacterium]|nr:ATP-binding cassette domain-containing protein [Alphaproteobacteria bacterium]
MSEPLLDIRSLRVTFDDRVAVEGLNLRVQAGQTTVLVGESGSGKSVTALAALGLLPPNAHVAGEILFASMDLLLAKASRLRNVRGGGLAMVFQEPMTSLNPVFTVGEQIEEAVRAHEPLARRSRRLRMEESLEEVGIDRRRRREYPHQFSGGM